MLHQSLHHTIFAASVVYDCIANLLVNGTVETKYVVLLILLLTYAKYFLNCAADAISIFLRIFSFIIASIIIIFNAFIFVHDILHQIYCSAFRTNVGTMPRFKASIAIFRCKSCIWVVYGLVLFCKMFRLLSACCPLGCVAACGASCIVTHIVVRVASSEEDCVVDAP